MPAGAVNRQLPAECTIAAIAIGSLSEPEPDGASALRHGSLLGVVEDRLVLGVELVDAD